MSLLFSISQCIRRHVLHIRTHAFLLLSTFFVKFSIPARAAGNNCPRRSGCRNLLWNPPNAPQSWARVCLMTNWTTKLLPNHCSFGEWPVCMLQPYSSADLLNAPRHQQIERFLNKPLESNTSSPSNTLRAQPITDSEHYDDVSQIGTT